MSFACPAVVSEPPDMSATALGVDGAVRPGLYPDIHLNLQLSPEDKIHALLIDGIAFCLRASLIAKTLEFFA